jgi:hypothetical protein
MAAFLQHCIPQSVLVPTIVVVSPLIKQEALNLQKYGGDTVGGAPTLIRSVTVLTTHPEEVLQHVYANEVPLSTKTRDDIRVRDLGAQANLWWIRRVVVGKHENQVQ